MAPVPTEEVEAFGKDFQAARRRQRPVQADLVRPAAARRMLVRAARRLLLAGPALRRRGRVPLGPRRRPCSCSSCRARRGRRPRPRLRDAQTWRRCGATPKLQALRLRAAAVRAALGQPATRAGSRCSRTSRSARRSTTPPTATRCRARHRRHGVHAWARRSRRTLPGFPRTFEPYGYDPEKAKALLAEAGVAEPHGDFWLSSDSPRAEARAGPAAAVGGGRHRRRRSAARRTPTRCSS